MKFTNKAFKHKILSLLKFCYKIIKDPDFGDTNKQKFNNYSEFILYWNEVRGNTKKDHCPPQF